MIIWRNMNNIKKKFQNLLFTTTNFHFFLIKKRIRLTETVKEI